MRHPGHLLANPLARRDAWHDLLLLRRTLDAESSQGRE
jgi:uracil-DNA glycosylase